MAGRFPDTHPVQRCFNPVRVFRNGHFDYFPCGRCSACLLDKANSWSMRLSNEIETFPYSIFFTLTYSNKYLPKLQFCTQDEDLITKTYYSSINRYNIRFDGKKDVRRDDDIIIDSSFQHIPIQNFGDDNYISYVSKRDIQLWLKLIRKDIFEYFNLVSKDERERKSYSLRYYIISEYGPLSRRGHYHGIFFLSRPDVAEFVLRLSMYKNWSMCDKALFDEYSHYCDGRAAGYVTQYLTCGDNLPKILKNEQIRPFRLSSKNPSIGFSSFNPSEIFENLFKGINEYNKSISRLEDNYVFPYPSEFMHRLLPKCREYGLVSPSRLRFIYGFLFRNVVKRGFSYCLCCKFLRSSEYFAGSPSSQSKEVIREAWFPQDITAAQKCYKYCVEFGFDVDTYLYLVDMYYYKEAMFALKKFYEWQELHFQDSVAVMFSYSNFQSYVTRSRNDSVRQNTLAYFLQGFGLTLDELSPHKYELLVTSFASDKVFRSEVEDILSNMVKMPKFNEKFGFAPHSY